MFKIGQRIRGWVMNDNGEMELVEGGFVFRTDDPEEYIQDIVVETVDGKYVYIDEQNIVRDQPVKMED